MRQHNQMINERPLSLALSVNLYDHIRLGKYTRWALKVEAERWTRLLYAVWLLRGAWLLLAQGRPPEEILVKRRGNRPHIWRVYWGLQLLVFGCSAPKLWLWPHGLPPENLRAFEASPNRLLKETIFPVAFIAWKRELSQYELYATLWGIGEICVRSLPRHDIRLEFPTSGNFLELASANRAFRHLQLEYDRAR